MFKFLYFFCVALRIILAPLIFLFPVPIVLTLFFLDAIDGELASKKVLTLEQYEKLDKALDFWQYTNEIAFAATNLKTYFPFLIILFIYRMIGEVMFFFKNNRKILVFFPNFFENVFLLIFLATYFKQLNFLITNNFYIYLIIVCILKIIQEWWLHWKKLSTMEVFFHQKKNWKV